MKRITITYSKSGNVVNTYFPSNRSGNSRSIKFLQQIRKEYIDDPYWFNFWEIKSEEGKLSDNKIRGIKKIRLQRYISRLKMERGNYLLNNAHLIKPDDLKVNIYTD